MGYVTLPVFLPFLFLAFALLRLFDNSQRRTLMADRRDSPVFQEADLKSVLVSWVESFQGRK
jgi:hypothetical protein